jgi:hypothetical protein
MAARNLTPGEIALGYSIFGTNIDFSAVQIYDRPYRYVATSIVAPNGNIYYPRSHEMYAADISAGTLQQRATFIHELGHVWQHQIGLNVIARRLFNNDYDFSDKIGTDVPFLKWGIEEQAAYFQDLYLASIGESTVTGVPLKDLVTVNTGLSDGPISDVVPRCFLAGTAISMWDGTKKPIEQIEAGDIVVSYDKDGNLKPGRVKRTMVNRSKQILDVHGLMVTPGHVTLCGDGRFNGQHVPILDILRSDGALVLEDGSKMRAGTGCRLGTIGDRMIKAIIGEQQPDGLVRVAEVGQIRAGTRFIRENGEDVSVLDMILMSGGDLTEDGMIQTSANGPKMPFRWIFTSSLPKPEDYVLQRSATHLQDIYQANEWEAVRPSMPFPVSGEAGATPSKHPVLVAAAPVNVPLALRNHPDAPHMNRRHRRANQAKARTKRSSVH